MEVSGLGQEFGHPTLVAAAGLPALGEQGGHLGFGGGSSHDVVDRRSTSDDGGRIRGEDAHAASATGAAPSTSTHDCSTIGVPAGPATVVSSTAASTLGFVPNRE